MIEFAKYVGLTLFAVVFLAMPSLLVLSIVFNWGITVSILLAGAVLIEILLFVMAIETLVDEGDL